MNFVSLLFYGITVLAFLSPSVWAGAECFNFDTPVRQVLPAALAPLNKLEASLQSGKHPKDFVLSGKSPGSGSGSGTSSKEKGVWGIAGGVVAVPIKTLYERLLDHYTIKDRNRTKLRVYDQEHPGYLNFHLVMVEIHPVPMVTVNWEEDWGYFLAEGTPDDPKKIVISYQKTNGSKLLAKLCGSIVLSASKEPGATGVFLYEEVEAFGKRSGDETAKGHLGTLATLRGIKG